MRGSDDEKRGVERDNGREEAQKGQERVGKVSHHLLGTLPFGKS